ncbi:MAG: hypothetical protein ACFFCS_26960 [Candidatus Hodarchaeota archaeon]
MNEREKVEEVDEEEEPGFKPVFISCPHCRVGYKSSLSKDLVKKMRDGLIRVLIQPDCNHKFIAFVDKGLNVRGYEKIDIEANNVQTADANFMKKAIKELERRHDEAKDSNYNEAFEIMKQLRKLKEDYKNLHKKIIIK